MHYFGGSGDNADQHLVFSPRNKECALETHSHAMPMNFTWGACETSTMKDHWNEPYPEGRVILCHSTQNIRGCWTYNGKGGNGWQELHVEDSKNSDKLYSNYYHRFNILTLVQSFNNFSRHISMGTYDGWPIVVGDTDGRGGLNGGNKTEVLTFNVHGDGVYEWTEFAEFPFAGEEGQNRFSLGHMTNVT